MTWTDVSNLATQLATLAGQLAAPVVTPQPVQTWPVIEYEAIATYQPDPTKPLKLMYPQVALDEWYDTRLQYTRYQRIVRIKKATGTLPFRVTDQDTGGGAGAGFKYPGYALYIDGKEVGRWAKGTNTTGLGQMPYDITGWKSGLYPGSRGAKLVPLDANGQLVVNPTGENYITHPEVWIDLDGTAANDPNCVVWSGNFELIDPSAQDTNRRADPLTHAWVVLPKSLVNAQPAPALPAWTEGQPFNTFDHVSGTLNGLTRTNLMPCTDGSDLNWHVPSLTKEGYLTFAGKHNYFWSDIVSDNPIQPFLDGVRGIGTAHHILALMPGRGGKVIFTHPWGAVKFDRSTGSVRTLFGLRSKNQQFPRYYEDATLDDYELVGDWSLWPADLPKRIVRCWGFFYDERTTVLDQNAAPVDGLQPHPGPVRAFWASEDGNIIRTSQPGNIEVAPTVVECWYRGLNRSWDIEHRQMPDGTLEIFVSCLDGIYVISGDKPQTLLRKLASVDPASIALLGSYSNPLKTWAGAPAASVRASFPTQVVGGEGLHWYGADKKQLLLSSYALGEARLYDPDSGAFGGVAARPTLSVGNKSHFLNGYVTTGNNGPDKAIMFTSFWEQYFGADLWLPVAGTLADGTAVTNSKQYQWQWIAYDTPEGAGNLTMPQTYPVSVGLHPDHPVILLGDTHDGIVEFRKSQPGDVLPNVAANQAGAKAYRTKQYQLKYGSMGFRRTTKEPMPFGVDPALDKWLTALGHQ